MMRLARRSFLHDILRRVETHYHELTSSRVWCWANWSGAFAFMDSCSRATGSHDLFNSTAVPISLERRLMFHGCSRCLQFARSASKPLNSDPSKALAGLSFNKLGHDAPRLWKDSQSRAAFQRSDKQRPKVPIIPEAMFLGRFFQIWTVGSATH